MVVFLVFRWILIIFVLTSIMAEPLPSYENEDSHCSSPLSEHAFDKSYQSASFHSVFKNSSSPQNQVHGNENSRVANIGNVKVDKNIGHQQTTIVKRRYRPTQQDDDNIPTLTKDNFPTQKGKYKTTPPQTTHSQRFTVPNEKQMVDNLRPHPHDSKRSTLPRENNNNIAPRQSMLSNIPTKPRQADSKQSNLPTVHYNPDRRSTLPSDSNLDITTQQLDRIEATVSNEADQIVKDPHTVCDKNVDNDANSFYRLQKETAKLKYKLVSKNPSKALEIEKSVYAVWRKAVVDSTGMTETTGKSFENPEIFVSKHRNKLPEELQSTFLDGIVFYHPTDRNLTKEFLRDIKNVGEHFKVELYDDVNLDIRSTLQHLEETCSHSMSIFVFVTDTVISNKSNNDNTGEYNFNWLFDEVVTYSMEGKNPVKNLVPVRACHGKMPLGTKSLKYLDFNTRNDVYFELLESHLAVRNQERRKLDSELLKKQYEWLKENMHL